MSPLRKVRIEPAGCGGLAQIADRLREVVIRCLELKRDAEQPHLAHVVAQETPHRLKPIPLAALLKQSLEDPADHLRQRCHAAQKYMQPQDLFFFLRNPQRHTAKRTLANPSLAGDEQSFQALLCSRLAPRDRQISATSCSRPTKNSMGTGTPGVNGEYSLVIARFRISSYQSALPGKSPRAPFPFPSRSLSAGADNIRWPQTR